MTTNLVTQIHDDLLNFRYSLNHLGQISAHSVRRLNFIFSAWEALAMARKPTKGNSTSNFADISFINYKLNKPEKAKFETWVEKQGNNIFDLAGELIATGHKFSHSQTPGEDVVRCSCTCANDTSPNYNYCMTSRGSTWIEAMALTIFKISELTNNGVWFDLDDGDNWG